eukprot:scaffold2321_cov124-Cylindrotheca_fusiformis.AAC.3
MEGWIKGEKLRTTRREQDQRDLSIQCVDSSLIVTELYKFFPNPEEEDTEGKRSIRSNGEGAQG